MSNNFVTSDLHLFHDNIIKYCNRPFENVHEMNLAIMTNWNKVVDYDDDTYIIGDFALIKGQDHNEKLERLNYITNNLNGRKHLIFGNHDYFSDEEYLSNGFTSVHHGILEINLNCHWWNMCHYQMTSWNNSFRGSYHLFGHEHWRTETAPNHEIFSKMQWSERKYNVCVDANNFTPINLNDLVRILDKRDTNFKEK